MFTKGLLFLYIFLVKNEIRIFRCVRITLYGQNLFFDLFHGLDYQIVKHNLSQVTNLWIYTESEVDGVIKDPCKGDSGGPLAVFQGSQPHLIRVLKVKT